MRANFYRTISRVPTWSRNLLLVVTTTSLIGCGDGAATTSDGSVATDVCGLSHSQYNDSPAVMAQSTYSWTCNGSTRQLSGNGIPDHDVVGGTFATPISVQTISQSFTLTPTNTGTASQGANIGYALNSVKFDPATAGTCASDATSIDPGGGCVAAMGQDPWRLEALGGAFMFGTDDSNAHVQPNGQYHYHGMPEGLVALQNEGQAMTLVGFARDGFPIYARYGLTDPNDLSSPTSVMTASWQLKGAPDAERPSVTTFPMGTFTQDYEYVAGSGDLDECNGRTGVTPEYPNGTYHYYITDTFPFIQRCTKGQL